jgi:hypothetical protein
MFFTSIQWLYLDSFSAHCCHFLPSIHAPPSWCLFVTPLVMFDLLTLPSFVQTTLNLWVYYWVWFCHHLHCQQQLNAIFPNLSLFFLYHWTCNWTCFFEKLVLSQLRFGTSFGLVAILHMFCFSCSLVLVVSVALWYWFWLGCTLLLILSQLWFG